MKYSIGLVAFVLFVSTSCQKSNDELYNEVMKIHDDAMIRMDDIQRQKRSFKNILKDTVGIDSARRTELTQMIMELDSANNGMMVWMRQFQPLPDSIGKEKVRKYLEEQKVQIQIVSDRINAALQKSRQMQ